jgi:hypothetical protein
LGYIRVYSGPSASGWGGQDGDEKFAIKKRVEIASPPSAGFHLAFHAQRKEDVHAFHEVAVKFGAKNNGGPGPRPEYGPKYYAAFVIDPDGYEIEVKLQVKDKMNAEKVK